MKTFWHHSSSHLPRGRSAGSSHSCQSIHQVALSTKQITVFANNAASALAKAQADNLVGRPVGEKSQ